MSRYLLLSVQKSASGGRSRTYPPTEPRDRPEACNSNLDENTKSNRMHLTDTFITHKRPHTLHFTYPESHPLGPNDHITLPREAWRSWVKGFVKPGGTEDRGHPALVTLQPLMRKVGHGYPPASPPQISRGTGVI